MILSFTCWIEKSSDLVHGPIWLIIAPTSLVKKLLNPLSKSVTSACSCKSPIFCVLFGNLDCLVVAFFKTWANSWSEFDNQCTRNWYKTGSTRQRKQTHIMVLSVQMTDGHRSSSESKETLANQMWVVFDWKCFQNIRRRDDGRQYSVRAQNRTIDSRVRFRNLTLKRRKWKKATLFQVRTNDRPIDRLSATLPSEWKKCKKTHMQGDQTHGRFSRWLWSQNSNHSDGVFCSNEMRTAVLASSAYCRCVPFSRLLAA